MRSKIQGKRYLLWGLYVLFIYSMIFSCKTNVYATITITDGTGGTDVSADTANNGVSPQWTTLSQIRIQEGANTDLAANINSGTIIITTPAGWAFNPNHGNVVATSGRDITAIDFTQSLYTITIIISTDGTANALDRINLNNMQVRPITGSNVPASGLILRVSSNPGTITLPGVTNDVTNFGVLSQTTGALFGLAIVLPGQSWGGAGVGVIGTPSYIFPNITHIIPSILAVDQFGNIYPGFTGSKTLSYAGVSAGSGANSVTNTVVFSDGASITVLSTTLTTPGRYKGIIASGSVVSGASTFFTILGGAYFITAPSIISMSSIGASSSSTNIQSSYVNFTIEDQKGYASGYYTTLQCSNLSDGVNTISNSNISLSGTGIILTSGSSNSSVYSSLTGSFQTCNTAIASLRRDTGGAGAAIYSQYSLGVKVSMTIPGRQSVGNYTGTITYTLIEN